MIHAVEVLDVVGLASRGDIFGDLLAQGLHGRKLHFVANFFMKEHLKLPPIELLIEVEEVAFVPERSALVHGGREADIGHRFVGFSVDNGRANVDAPARRKFTENCKVRRWSSELSPQLLSFDDLTDDVIGAP